MYSTHEEIKAAVDAYRSHIAGHNRRVLEVFVRFISLAELDPEDWGDDVEDLRVDCFSSVLGRDLRTFISTPEDILKHYDELASRYDLDGCGGPLLTSDEDVSRRELYFSHLESALKGKCLEEVRDRITAPPELRVLAEHVSALTGPGLGCGKSRYQATFWTGAGPQADLAIDAMVKAPEELMVNTPWECAAGWESGDGVDSDFYIVFCRRNRPPDQEAEPWAWRYMAMGPDDCEVFDTIPELLKWYSRFRERGVPDIEDLDEQEVLEGQIY
ncbi:hypothetical protein CCHL11_05874 [Colletotrichum chlorophyti]|uniref:Knr4/Smi1-like domain-containing protein n=1 Tax=Colletotrichum chlorophyti TaxID=708187 RepID=A0A1Q8RMU6_9PEZI|nr:hypothetical protein CCHL11_05874 [Colletotrichum chlorophyti]